MIHTKWHAASLGLLSISTHCLDLIVLETQFGILMIVDDIEAVRDKIERKAQYSIVWNLLLLVHGEDNEATEMELL